MGMEGLLPTWFSAVGLVFAYATGAEPTWMYSRRFAALNAQLMSNTDLSAYSPAFIWVYKQSA